MRRFIILLGVLIGSSLSAYGQSYRVSRPISLHPPISLETEKPVPLVPESVRWELGVRGVDSIGSIKDFKGIRLGKQLAGGKIEAGYRIFRQVWAGLDFEALQATDQQTSSLSTIKREQFTFTVKWVLTPDTNSKVYLLAGIGKSFYQTKFILQNDKLQEKSFVYVLGVGEDLKLYKQLYLALQYRFTYEATPWKNFVLQASRIRNEIAVGLTYKF